MATDSRASMVRSAASLIRSRGVSATSFSDVLADSGAPRGSIYHHFPDGKAQLAEDAIRWTSERLLGHLRGGHPTRPSDVLERFIAIIIGYLPVLYQAFSRRELTIAMLDARAGSPPSAGQLLLRLARGGKMHTLNDFLVEWERWAAETLESHLSFPVLTYYRSQHDNQSWLATLTVILDTGALLLAAVKDANSYQAQLTFAMARHAIVDLAMVFRIPPHAPEPERLPDLAWQRLCGALHEAGLAIREGPAVEEKLRELRTTYEPFVNAMAGRLLFTLPVWLPATVTVDNWQTSAWTARTAGIGSLPLTEADREHLD